MKQDEEAVLRKSTKADLVTDVLYYKRQTERLTEDKGKLLNQVESLKNTVNELETRIAVLDLRIEGQLYAMALARIDAAAKVQSIAQLKARVDELVGGDTLALAE